MNRILRPERFDADPTAYNTYKEGFSGIKHCPVFWFPLTTCNPKNRILFNCILPLMTTQLIALTFSYICGAKQRNLLWTHPSHLQTTIRPNSEWTFAKAEVSSQRLQLQDCLGRNTWTTSSGMPLYLVYIYPTFTSDCSRTIHSASRLFLITLDD